MLPCSCIPFPILFSILFTSQMLGLLVCATKCSVVSSFGAKGVLDPRKRTLWYFGEEPSLMKSLGASLDPGL